MAKLLAALRSAIACRPPTRGALTEFLPAEEQDYPILNRHYIAFERAAVSFLCKQDVIEPNHITYFRLGVCLLLISFYSELSYLSILILALLGGLSDFFDGAFARSASKKTRLGVLIDPLADKILIFTVVYILIMRKALDPLYVLLMVILETHVLIVPLLSWFYSIFKRRPDGVAYSTSKNKRTATIVLKTKPVFVGKLKVGLYMFALLSLMLGKAGNCPLLVNLAHGLLISGICAGAAAFGIYLLRWSRQPHPLS